MARGGTVSIGKDRVDYAQFGEGSKVLVILPGLSESLVSLKGKALLLSMPYRKYLKDFTIYMFGRRSSIPMSYSIKDMADDQAKAMKELGIKQADVMGVSQGGMIAQELAINNPELVSKLVIAVSAPQANSTIQNCLNKWVDFAKAEKHKELMIDTAEKSYSETYLKKYRKIYPVIGLIGKPKSYEKFIRNAEAILKFDVTNELKTIKNKTLIIGGSEDKIVRVKASYELHEKISNSMLYIYNGLGHAAYEEAKNFNERVFSFLNNS